MFAKKFIALVCVFSLFFCGSVYAIQQNPARKAINPTMRGRHITYAGRYDVTSHNGRTLEVIVEDKAIGEVTTDDLMCLVSSASPNCYAITVYGTGLTENATAATMALQAEPEFDIYDDDDITVTTRAFTFPVDDILATEKGIIKYRYKTTKSYEKTSSGLKRTGRKLRIPIVVAKGQTITLDTDKKWTWSGEISGQYFVSFTAGGACTVKYSRTDKYTGPTTAGTNSRYYYYGFKYYFGPFTQKKYDYASGKLLDTKNGTFKEPFLPLCYSEDVKV